MPLKFEQLYNVLPVEWGIPHPGISGDDSLLVYTLPFLDTCFCTMANIIHAYFVC